MSDAEDFSEDIEGSETRSSDESDTEGSLKDFIASEDDEGDSTPSTDEDSSDDVEPELIVTGKRKRTVLCVSDSPEIETDSDDPDYEPGDCD